MLVGDSRLLNIRVIKNNEIIYEGMVEDAAQADTLEEQISFGQAIAKGILKTLGITSENEPNKEQVQDTNILKWQKMMNRVYNCGLAEDNCFGPDSKAKANKYCLYNKRPIIKNEHVKFIQERLCKYEFNVDIDSKFGPDCENKTKKFQTSKGLKSDGKVGADTTKELLK